MASPPKPWERPGTGSSMSSATSATTAIIQSAPAAAANNNNSDAPTIPARPSTLTQPAASTSALQNSYSSPLGGYGGGYNRFGSSYASPYGGGGYGGYGSSLYGGGYGGGMYGGGMGYGGYGSYGGGYGMGNPYGPMGPHNPMDPNAQISLSQSLEASTAQTFQVLQSIVGAFGGFAQMLESTFMATHSSFFAMVGVAEQLGNLRNVLGSVLGLFGLVRWVRDVLTGTPRYQGAMGNEFGEFLLRPPGAGPPPPKPSKKPLIIFLAAMIGLPYLMHRLIRSLSMRLPPPPHMNPNQQLDPNQITFVRALHTFSTPESQELKFEKGDLIAVMLMTDPVTGMESEWWRGRKRGGEEGWFPRNYVEVVKRPGQDVKPEIEKEVKSVA